MLTKIFKGLLGALALCALFIVVATVIIDPNDYKKDIEQKAFQTTGIKIKIDGQLAWSFIPLGFSVEDIYVFDREGELFTQLQHIDLSVDTLSLFSLAPVITGIYASGSKITLKIDRNGNKNWSNLITKTAAVKPDGYYFQNVNTTVQAPRNPALFMPVRHLHIDEFEISYINELQNQNIEISNLDIEIDNAELEKYFPVHLAFDLKTNVKDTRYRHTLDSSVYLNNSLDNIKLQNLVNNIDLSGDFTHQKQIELSLTGSLDYNLTNRTLRAANVQLSGAGIALDTDLLVNMSEPTPAISGQFNIAPFSLVEVSSHLGTSLSIRDTAFNSISLKSPFEYKNNELLLSSFDLELDTSQFIGRLRSRPNDMFIDLTVKGDKLILDNYLAAFEPAESKDHIIAFDNTRVGAIESPPPKLDQDKPLLPLELLRELELELDVKQDVLVYGKTEVRDIILSATSEDALIKIKELEANVYEGHISTQAMLDVRGEPVWDIKSNGQSIDLSLALAALDINHLPVSASGKLNFDSTIEAIGNTTEALERNNSGYLNLGVANGTITGLNLDQVICEGVAQINRKPLSDQGWSSNTALETLTMMNKIDNGRINTTSLNLESENLSAAGFGYVDLIALKYNHSLSAKPKSSEIESACAVNQKFANLEIPVKCSGSFGEAPSNACGLDSEKMNALIASLFKSEVTRKSSKELDRALNKYLDKDSDTSKALKKNILKLFSQ